MKYQKKGNGIYMNLGASKLVDKIDGIIFDCDGVLVDVSRSYDLAIKEATMYVLERFAGIKSIPITTEIISGFKATGGFNDEVDVTYASILALAAAKKIGANPKKFINKVISNANETGIESVEKYLDKLKIDISPLQKKLDYPGPHSTNPLYVIFDQIFYGPELYKKMFRRESQFSKTGLIENDKVILTKKLLTTLGKKFRGRLAIVTGRGKVSIAYSLEDMLSEFNLKSSVFLEDKPRSLAKPNPQSLVMSYDKLDVSCCLYVGDSMEDLIMARKANRTGRRIVFCGIYGTSKNPASKIKFFEKNKVPMTLESISQLPKALNLAK
jgi:phosphoglycolate phosphatase-like HAD superfamily hydrolase